MSMICKICSHPKRLDIDRALVQGQTLTSIAKKYGMTEAAVMNHRDKHLSRQLMTAATKRDLMHSNGLLDILENLLQTTNLVISEAWKQKKLGVCLNGVSKAAGIVKIVSDMVYGLRELELRKVEVETPRTINVKIVDDDDNEIDTSKLPPVNREMPVHRRSLPEPEPAIEPVQKRFRRKGIKDNPEPEPDRKDKTTDEFEKMRRRFIKPDKVPDEIETFSDAELDEIDFEGMTLRERMEIRPLFERAH